MRRGAVERNGGAVRQRAPPARAPRETRIHLREVGDLGAAPPAAAAAPASAAAAAAPAGAPPGAGDGSDARDARVLAAERAVRARVGDVAARGTAVHRRARPPLGRPPEQRAVVGGATSGSCMRSARAGAYRSAIAVGQGAGAAPARPARPGGAGADRLSRATCSLSAPLARRQRSRRRGRSTDRWMRLRRAPRAAASRSDALRVGRPPNPATSLAASTEPSARPRPRPPKRPTPPRATTHRRRRRRRSADACRSVTARRAAQRRRRAPRARPLRPPRPRRALPRRRRAAGTDGAFRGAVARVVRSGSPAGSEACQRRRSAAARSGLRGIMS